MNKPVLTLFFICAKMICCCKVLNDYKNGIRTGISIWHESNLFLLTLHILGSALDSETVA
jgi:hypothetical protein